MLPDYEKTRIPEGAYQFEIISDPEKRRKTSSKTGKDFVIIQFKFRAIDSDGDTFDHSESFLGFEDKYADLLLVLGATEDKKGNLSGQTIEPLGMKFNAEIVYEEDKNKPDTTWARIRKIQAIEEGEIKSDPKEKDRFHDPEEELPVRSPAEKEAEDDDEMPF